MDDRLPPSSSAPSVAGSAANAAAESATTVPVVVVTRPRAQAPMLVTALERHGLRTHQFPLLDIAPTPNLEDLRAALGDPSRYALVVFVSPNAVQQAFAAMPEGFRWPQEVPVAVVGPASAQALATHGVAPPAHRVIRPDTHADDARQDSEALYARLDVPSLAGREVLIVRGNGGREWLADQLREAGVSVRTVFRLFDDLDSLVEVAVEQIESAFFSANEFEFVQDFSCERFFFDLLGNIPLQKIMSGIIFFLQTNVN